MNDIQPSFQIITVPCLADNYAYLVHDIKTQTTALVDAPESKPVMKALAQHGWNLDLILITHHHYDHIDGIDELRKITGAKVVGARQDAHRLPMLDLSVEEGDHISIGSMQGTVIDVTGHTIGHIAYFFPKEKIAFTGDSLMSAGCGRLFEGTPQQMWNSLSKLAALPADTAIYSGHEYTLSNLRFAHHIEPQNQEILKRIESAQHRRDKHLPTIPVILSQELATNPFLRANENTIKEALGMNNASGIEIFTKIRKEKDTF